MNQNPGLLVKVIPCHGGNQTATSEPAVYLDSLGCSEIACVYQFGTTTTGTSGTATISLSECATTGGTYTAITGATTAALVTDTGGQNAKRHLIYLKSAVGRLRYIKAILTIAGTAATGATGPLSNGCVLMGGGLAKTLSSSDFDSATTV